MPFRGISLDFVSKELTPRPLPAGPAFCQIVGNKLSPSRSPVNGTFVLQSPTAPHLTRSHLPCGLDIPLHLFSSNAAEHSEQIPAKLAGTLHGARTTATIHFERAEKRGRTHREPTRRRHASQSATEPQAGLPTTALATRFVPASFAGMEMFLVWLASEQNTPIGAALPALSSHHAEAPRTDCFLRR